MWPVWRPDTGTSIACMPQNGLGVVAWWRMLILDRRPLGRWLLTAVREHLGAASRAATYR